MGRRTVRSGRGRILPNFAEYGELGAAVTVFVGGRKVVDLWGGVADERGGRAWDEDTVVPVFSCAKGIVEHLRPPPRAGGTAGPRRSGRPVLAGVRAGAPRRPITPRMVLGHRAGLPVLDRVLSFEEIAEWTPVIRAIEEQEPLWEPGRDHEYHGHVFGFLIGEVIRRITGLTPGPYFRQAIGDRPRIADLDRPAARTRSGTARLVEAGGRPAMPDPESLITRMVTMNGALAFPGLEEPHGWNDPALLGMELPGAGAVASASGLAALYAAAVTGVNGRRGCSHRETVTDAVRELSSGVSWSGFPTWVRVGDRASCSTRPGSGPCSGGAASATTGRRPVRLRGRRVRRGLRLCRQPDDRPWRRPGRPAHRGGTGVL